MRRGVRHAPATARGTGWSTRSTARKNFVRGVPVWATLIALLVDRVAGARRGQRAGAGPALVGRPRPGRLRRARSAVPPRRLRVSAVQRAGRRQPVLLLAVRLGRSRPAAAVAGADGQQVWRSRAYGDFWSYMLVAEGAVDLAAEPELSLWDMAALAPIVTEAGGRFTGLNGVAGVQQGNAAASNGLLHAAAAGLLDSAIDGERSALSSVGCQRPIRPYGRPAARPATGRPGAAWTGAARYRSPPDQPRPPVRKCRSASRPAARPG